MKKVIILLIIVVIVVLSGFTYFYHQSQEQQKEAIRINQTYEAYLNKEILGTNVISLINKTMDDNAKRQIEKDEKGQYKDNGKNSILIQVQFKIEKDKTYTYRMEQIAKQGSEAFIRNFGAMSFRCTKIDYHEATKRVKMVYFEQV